MGKFDDYQELVQPKKQPYRSKCKVNGCSRYASEIDSYYDDDKHNPRPKGGMCLHHHDKETSEWGQITLKIRKLEPVFAVWDRIRAPGSFGLSVVEMMNMEMAEIPGFPETKPAEGINAREWGFQLKAFISDFIEDKDKQKKLKSPMEESQLKRLSLSDVVNKSYRRTL